MNRHTFTDDPFHSRQADPELVLQQFAYRTQTAIPQVVDVIGIANAVKQIKEIVD
ncbi:hypothetical protein NBRC111894_3299 [Sporolactobacillus inulinus]|uniref:Uncharacterized protein n=1 Tax=Sporolactobacillus inulinus TaxID=2078 RepID=A0A4Y1ZFA3_9BACL|nr:hypothetical protein NBRC111894_3299 [Sporolactobacillus inulinus]